MQLSLGHRLAGARRARGLSILDVSHKTRISPGNIRSIESDHFTECPNLVYAKGFLKQLDRYLDAGLGQEIASFDTGPTITSPDVLITVPDQPRFRSSAPVATANETRPTFIGLMVGLFLVVTLPVAAIKWHGAASAQSGTGGAVVPPPRAETGPTNPPPQTPQAAIELPHLPHDAPPELDTIARLEDNVDLDELSPPALPATQPVPSSYSIPAIAAAAPRSDRSATPTRKPVAAKPPTQDSNKKKSFFSRLFNSKPR